MIRRLSDAAAPLSLAPAFAYISEMNSPDDGYLIRPDALDPRLTERAEGVDQTGAAIETPVTVERALTIFLNFAAPRKW
jgi:hypothetical protein